MENIPNPFTELFNKLNSFEKSHKRIESKMDLILKKLGKVDLHNEFNIKGQKAAAKILGDSMKTLQNKIKEGKLKKNYHYQKNDTKRYFFSETALTSDKGLI